ncbi:G-protein coupled receptor 161-like [Glandiceps talaboti]
MSVSTESWNSSVAVGNLTTLPISLTYVTLETGSSKDVVAIVLKAITLAVIIITSVFLNILISLTLYRKSSVMTTGNRYVFSLTLPNGIFSGIVLPFVFISILYDDWIFGVVWCNFTGFVTMTTLSGSMVMLAIIALDRYYAIVRPMLYPLAFTNTRSVPIILCGWLVAVICSIPPAFGWSKYKFNTDKSSCLPEWNKHISYSVFLLIVCYLAPFVTMVICYVRILSVARTKARKVNIGNMMLESPRRHSTGSTFDNKPDSPRRHSTDGAIENRRISFSSDVGQHHSQRRHSDSSAISEIGNGTRPRKRSRSSLSLMLKVNSPSKALKTVSLLLGVTLLTLGPMCVCISCEAIHSANDIPSSIVVMVTWLAFSASLFYPCIYGLWSETIRKGAYYILCRKSQTLDDDEILFLQSRRASRAHSMSDSVADLTKMQLALLQFRANRSNSLASSGTGITTSDSGTLLTCIDETDYEEGDVGTPSGIVANNTGMYQYDNYGMDTTNDDDARTQQCDNYSIQATAIVHCENTEIVQNETPPSDKGIIKYSSDEGVHSFDDETDREAQTIIETI